MALKSELDDNPLAPPIPEDDLQAALQYRERFANEDDFIEALKVWPRCPECGKLRETRCPVCNTSGSLFPLGDAEFWDNRTEDERARDAQEFGESNSCSRYGCRCSCGTREALKLTFDESERPSTLDGELMPGVPSPRWFEAASQKTSDVFDDMSDERRRATVDEGVQPALCPVCAEAFEPQFGRVCERCGYIFGDGASDSNRDASTSSDVDEFLARKNAEDDSVYEANNARMFWTILVLTLGSLAAVVYFMCISQ